MQFLVQQHCNYLHDLPDHHQVLCISALARSSRASHGWLLAG
jgi:hypothetical protein